MLFVGALVGWLVILAYQQPGPCRADVFLLGYITGSERRPGEHEYSRPGLSISGAITLAVEEINRQAPLRDGHSLDFVVAETFGEETESILQTASLWTKNVSVYIGPQETCIHEARMAASFNLPMISYFCARYETSDKSSFPTFARTRPPDMHISKSVASVLLSFGWRKVTFLYSSAKEFELEEIAETILKTLDVCGVEVVFRKTWDVTYHHGYLDNPFLHLVDQTYVDSRIYVILGQYYEHIGLMVTMQKKGLFDKGEYFVVGVDIEQYDIKNPGVYLKGLLKDQTEDIAKVAFRSYIGVMASPPTTFEEFTEQVNAYMEKPPFNFPNPLKYFQGMKRIRAEAAYLYDAVHVYARALNDCLADGEDPYNGTTIFNYLKSRTYKSAMGFLVHIDENGDAEGNYTLVARKSVPKNNGQFGLYPIGVFEHTDNGSIPVLRLTSFIEWVVDGPPVDEPHCGFRGEKCITRTVEIVAGVAGGTLLTLVLVLLVVYRNWKYEQELDSLLWKIDYKDIQVNEFTPTNTNGTKSVRTIHSVMRTSQVSLSSNPDTDFRYSTIFTQIGTYKGHIFAVKRVRKKSIDITRKVKKALKIMRDMRHDNLNSFIGACVDPPNICIVTEYCTRGSLQDILENEDVKLDNMFVASLVGDILRGMIYLHDSPIRCHGRLQSTNCLVDSRWVLKIADFGLHEFKAGAEMDDDAHDPYRIYQSLLYRAPELLRDPQAPPCGTQKGDVYSFAIILYEIHCRHGPYGATDMTSQEILKRVIDGQSVSGTAYRPQLELLENPFDFVRSCLKECWSENPDERPDFKAVRQKLRPLRKGMRPNIFDNMIAMMEKYANNLEALVDEKTVQLMEEKKKTEALLFEMLPRYVAEQLRRGNKVEAESFDCVTIYFSDIVGFTAMSAESTPLQVVEFLNDLYTCFDSIIENYDVYKVETIGDAYMVVSGLPIRNGNLHAGEIASMSIHLLESIKKAGIRHRPQDNLMLRIGIHSGPVCAGVVGLKMPRYCLFGDTVNTASRMESNGLPLRIHCSQQCQEILEKLGGYCLDERGLIKMKGKGEMKTYWLTGEDEENRVARINQRSTRLNSIRTATNPCATWGDRMGGGGLNGCVPNSTRSSFRKPNSPLSESPKRLRFATRDNHHHDDLDVPDNAVHLMKRNSCPCITDVPDSPTEVPSPVGGRRGCSSASLFFADQPGFEVRVLDVTPPPPLLPPLLMTPSPECVNMYKTNIETEPSLSQTMV